MTTAAALRQTALPSPSQTYTYIGDEPLRLGRGFDSLSGEFRADVLASTASTQNQTGSKYSYNIHLVEDSSQLKRMLRLSLSASYGLASASAEFSSELNLNTSCICLVAQMTVEFAAKTVDSNRGAKEILDQLRNLTVSDVYQQIGDQFVDAITVGGEIFVVLRIQAVDESDKERLAVQVKGSYGAFSAQASFESSIEKVTSHKETDIKIIGRGGVPKAAATLQDALDGIRDLAALTAEKAYPIRFHVSPLTVIIAGTELPAGEVPRLGRSFDWLQKASDVYDQLMYQSSTWRQYKNVKAKIYEADNLDALSSTAISLIDAHVTQLAQDVTLVRSSVSPALPDLSRYLTGLKSYPKALSVTTHILTTTVTIFLRGSIEHTISNSVGSWIVCNTPAFIGPAEFISRISLSMDGVPGDLSIEYKAIQRIDVAPPGETQWVPAGTTLGLPNLPYTLSAYNLEGLAVRLTGVQATNYSVKYQVQNHQGNPTQVYKDGDLAGVAGTALIAVKVWLERLL